MPRQDRQPIAATVNFKFLYDKRNASMRFVGYYICCLFLCSASEFR